MVVWQGITEGGTAVPVQITEEGKVVAIGEAGPRGPEGPPGQAEWPPNPIEGAFLVWLNGEPTWYTEQPIPTPPGIAGPITEVSDNSLLTFASNVDQNTFFQGVQVYAVNADGSSWDGGGIYNTSQVWSQYLTTDGSFTGSTTAQNAFDGLVSGAPSSKALTETSSSFFFTPPNPIFCSTFGVYTERRHRVMVVYGNDNTLTYDFGSDANGQSTLYSIPSSDITSNGGSIKSFSITELEGGVWTYLYGVEVDGRILLDKLLGPYPTGQISTVANNSVLLSRVQGVWSKDLYMKADEGAQAAWLISKNRNGTI